MSNKKINAFLVIGALGAGKSTVCKYLADTYFLHSVNKKQFKHIDLDAHIQKCKKMEVKEYFGKVGYEKFYEESFKYIKTLWNRHVARNSETVLLIDVGSGSTFDYKSTQLTQLLPSILLTADPEYLFKREKCVTSHKELGYYKFWQFGKEKEQLYSQCKIKIDVSYMTIAQVAYAMCTKIVNFQNQN